MLPSLQVSSIKVKENLFIFEMRNRKNGVEKFKSYFNSVAQRMGEVLCLRLVNKPLLQYASCHAEHVKIR